MGLGYAKLRPKKMSRWMKEELEELPVRLGESWAFGRQNCVRQEQDFLPWWGLDAYLVNKKSLRHRGKLVDRCLHCFSPKQS